MAISNWTRPESPFHQGELALQARVGIQERMDKQGRRIVREYLTEQHRQFFAQLPYAIAGTVDASGYPWASILVGDLGFFSTPDERTLRVDAKPLLGDPLAENLVVGHDIGFLGIELHSRRRNRMNGVISATDDDGFTVQVRQTFGNCPQYIQARQFEWVDCDPIMAKPVRAIAAFSDQERSAISTADTFFITTAYQDKSAGLASGVDVSHRGGKPGFVRIDGDDMLTIPDFSGNGHFNTLGNIELNPRTGLLFVDFDRGSVLYLTGATEVIWEGDEISTYEGAKRLLRFRLKKGYWFENSLPLRWSAPEFSPFLDRTGSW